MLENNRYYRRYVEDVTSGYVFLRTGFIKKAVLDSFLEINYRLATQIVKDKKYVDDNYFKDTPYIPVFTKQYNNFSKDLINRFRHLYELYQDSNLQPTISNIIIFIQNLENEKLLSRIILSYLNLLNRINQQVKFLSTEKNSYAVVFNEEDKVLLKVDLKKRIQNDLSKYKQLDNTKFVNMVSLLDMKIRRENRNPTPQEYLTRQVAFEMINIRGYTDAPIVPWGNSGFRKIQTQASITDPGFGHLTGTTRKMEYINGTNVHVEYLERGMENDRELVEPYRLPDLATIGKIKMSVGKDTSVSSYVGRPMFENTFEHSFIKTIHTTIATCSAIFMNGLSECKIAIEKMTTTQAIDFMRVISANVVRDSSLQVLAAAFCINYPLIDDRTTVLNNNNGRPRKVTDRMEIARLGIEITKAGNFDKVTFDGTANWYPSEPIMEQLGYQNALELVHKAHEVGLLTYFSAGFRFKNLPDIVNTGTDGIGLGGAQILRFMDSKNGYQGPFKQENIKKILDINQKTANGVIGQGGILLSRLDRMFFEGSLPRFVDIKRKKLYEAMLQKDIDKVAMTIDDLSQIVSMPNDTVHPLVAWAERLLENKDNELAFCNMTKAEKETYIHLLEKTVADHDYSELSSVLNKINSNRKF